MLDELVKAREGSFEVSKTRVIFRKGNVFSSKSQKPTIKGAIEEILDPANGNILFSDEDLEIFKVLEQITEILHNSITIRWIINAFVVECHAYNPVYLDFSRRGETILEVIGKVLDHLREVEKEYTSKNS